MVNAKLNDNYGGDFLTTQLGTIFYRKDNSLNKEAKSVEIDINNQEITSLIEQNILIVDEDSLNVKNEIVNDNVINDKKIIKKVKTKSNDKKIIKD